MKLEVFGAMQGMCNVDGIRVRLNRQEAQVKESVKISAQKDSVANMIRMSAAIWTDVRGLKDCASRTTGQSAGAPVCSQKASPECWLPSTNSDGLHCPSAGVHEI